MKLALVLLTVFVVIGLIAGIILVVSGKIALAGIVWAITVILSCIARRIEICRKTYRKSKQHSVIRFEKSNLTEKRYEIKEHSYCC